MDDPVKSKIFLAKAISPFFVAPFLFLSYLFLGESLVLVREIKYPILALAHKHLPDHADRGLLIPTVHKVTSRTLDEFEEALHHVFVHEFDGINYEVAVERGAVPSAAFFRGIFAFCHETVYRCRLAMREEQRAWLEVLGDDKVPRQLREPDSDVVGVGESRTTRDLELIFFHDLEQVVSDFHRELRVVVDLKQKVVAKSPRQVELDCQAPMSHDAVLL